MLALALRGLFARKLRAALTGFAVVLGVGFMAGTLVFTDTIDQSFKDLFERASKGADVQVSARDPLDATFSEPEPFDASVLDRVRDLEGVSAAAGGLDANVTLYDPQGERLGSPDGPAFAIAARPEPFDPLTYEDGGPIDAPDEVGVDLATAEREGLQVGDTVTVAGEAAPKDYRIGAIFTLGEARSLGGAGTVVLTLDEVQARAGVGDRLGEVVLAAERGTDQEELEQRVGAALRGTDVIVETGKEAADRQAAETSEDLGFLSTALLVFAGVALLVGGFLIYNTFAITVAQRQGELALLRMLGASRRQVLRAVLVEALAIGLMASALGVLAGIALAAGLRGLLASSGIELPNTGTVIATRTVLTALLVGTLVTVVAAAVPARRATRVEPLAALRESSAPARAGRLPRRRIAVAVGLLVVALAVELIGLFGGRDATATALLLGLGAVVAIFAVALLSPLLVRPLAHVAGRPLARGLPGRLARENAERQPQRTAITAAALMIGLALVVFVAVFAAGFKASITGAVEEDVRADVIVVNDDGFSPIPAEVARTLAGVEGIETVSAIRFALGRIGPESEAISGVDPRTIARLVSFEWAEGSQETIAGLRDDQVIVEDGFAETLDVGPGARIEVLTATGERVMLTVAGVFRNRPGPFGDLIVTSAVVAEHWRETGDALVLARGSGGANLLVKRASAALERYPTADALTKEAFTDKQAGQVDQVLGLLYGLLSLSVVVSLLGIVNTLALAVHERTRELGMLRAVGMSRRQVRAMVRAEAVITALIGAVLGLALGIVFAILISRPLASEGFELSIPVGTLLVLAVLAALSGVLASILPARRAARVDVLRAVTTE